jgi:hypothetical protein
MDHSHGFEFIEVSSLSEEMSEDVKRLWKENQVMDVQTRNNRLKEIAMLVRSHTGELAGVSTAKKVRSRLFNNNYLFEFRCFIAPAHRQPALDTQLVVKTKDFLERSRQQDDEPAIGLVMVVENEALKQWTRTVWAGADFYFAGYTSQGHHIRVSWFKDALI